MFKQVAVLGLGKVGTLVALLLKEAGFEVTGYDQQERKGLGFTAKALDTRDEKAVGDALGKVDALVSCLPYHLNLPIAKIAHKLGKHYFDLTEDVPTTQAIQAMSSTAKAALVPQCGLAPGIIGIIGASLARQFDTLDTIHLRVGALPRHPTGELGYAFNWSAEGVVNEYINACEVIQQGRKMEVPALEQFETIRIEGLSLEAFTTSGGLGTMCETYLGRVRELNYKSMRYPGHGRMMKFLLEELNLASDREFAVKLLTKAKPPVEEDVVYLHAAVNGTINGQSARKEFVNAYTPVEVNGQEWRAISWTTAASVAAVVELVAKGKLPQKGFVRQEDILLDDFLATKNGRYYKG
ncbi:L-lysine dehydrogenase [bacterium]|nr:L-lysine dehydrogenase [bacterium]